MSWCCSQGVKFLIHILILFHFCRRPECCRWQEVPTHPMNFAGLANFSSAKEQLFEEFGVIPQVYPKVEELPEGAETKNRYANVIPLPETRVHLSVRNNDPLSDYINANYVRGNKGAEKLYIACQGPMESTIEDFWRMVWEQQCKVILMITNLQENGKVSDVIPFVFFWRRNV